MKKILLMILSTAATFGVSTSIFSQSYFVYQNASVSAVLLYNYDTGTSTKMFGSAGGYDFGLYMGSAGSTDLSQMQLVALASSPNAAASSSFNAGLFSYAGGTVYSPGNVANTIDFQAGTQYAFLIAGWSAVAGSTYQQAEAYGSDVFLGISDLGFITPVDPPDPAPRIFGTSAGEGQVLGFTLYGTPEPATLALGSLGAAAILLLRRRK